MMNMDLTLGALPLQSGESGPPPAAQQSWLVCYRLFDVGEKIRLDELQKLFAGRNARRMTMAKQERMFEQTAAPVGIDLGERQVAGLDALGGRPRARAHFFPFGVVSISYEVPLPRVSLEALIGVSARVQESVEITNDARALVEELSREARSAYRGAASQDHETFTLFYVQKLAEGMNRDTVLRWFGLGKLLAGETGRGDLDIRHRTELLEYSYSYIDDDLVVIDHNAAFVLQPSGVRDVPLLIELANAQLLALRYYDHVVDEEMSSIYEELSGGAGKSSLLGRRYGRLAHRVIRRSVEVREFSDLIGNSIKVVGDFYLARCYRGAVRRLRIPDWQASIAQKLDLASAVYTMLKGELDHSRSLLLEILVVLLIVIEVVMGFVGH